MKQVWYVFVLVFMLNSNAFGLELRGVKHSAQQGVILNGDAPTLLVAYRTELKLKHSVINPIAQLSLVTHNKTQLTLVPRFSVGATARLDIFEIVPYVSGRLGTQLNGGGSVRGTLSIGGERIYQDGWFYNLEAGAQLPLTRRASVGGILLFGFGLATNFDELV